MNIIDDNNLGMTLTMTTDSKFIDLSHTVFDGLCTYKGLPPPVICDYLSRVDSKKLYANHHTVQIGRIDMVSNTGTYLDCAFHFNEHGCDLSQLSLEQLANLPGFKIDATQTHSIDASHFKHLEGRLQGAAVLVFTNWARHWNTEKYFEDHPFLTQCAAQYLFEQGVKLVGIDSHNIDDTRGALRPVHENLLGNNILICEHLCNLEKLSNEGFQFSAIPPKISGMGTFPVRAFASI